MTREELVRAGSPLSAAPTMRSQRGGPGRRGAEQKKSGGPAEPNQDLMTRPSANLIRELSMAGNPLLAAPPVQLIVSPGITVLCDQP